MRKGPVEHLIIGFLHPLSDGITTSAHLTGFDDTHLKEWYHRYCQEERHHEVDSNGDGEIFQTVMEHTFHRDEEGVEDGTDADGGQHHWHEVLMGRLDSSL